MAELLRFQFRASYEAVNRYLERVGLPVTITCPDCGTIKTAVLLVGGSAEAQCHCPQTLKVWRDEVSVRGGIAGANG